MLLGCQSFKGLRNIVGQRLGLNNDIRVAQRVLLKVNIIYVVSKQGIYIHIARLQEISPEMNLFP